MDDTMPVGNGTRSFEVSDGIPVEVESIQSSPSVEQNDATGPSNKRKRRGQGKGRETSDVWNGFLKKPEIGVDGLAVKNDKGDVSMKAYCKKCDGAMVFGGSSGTSHLRAHLVRCQRKSSDTTQPIVGINEKGQVCYFTFSQARARAATVKYFVKEDIPFNKVDKPTFREWILESFGPQFKPPCRITLKNDVMQFYGEYRATLKDFFRDVPGKICLTSDLWTSIQKLGYMCITAHFISSDWKLCKRIITFSMLPSPHTGKAISEGIYGSLLSWNICDKIETISLDNATNNDVAVTLLKESLFDKMLSKEILHIRCNAHVMNIMVKAGLFHLGSSLENIKKSLIYINSSPARLQNFKANCRDLNVKEKTLPIEVPTRWDSTYLMLEAAIPYQRVIDLFFCGTDFVNVPSRRDWQNAIVIRDFFKVFKESTKLFSGTKYVTSTTFCFQLIKISLVLKKYSEVPCFKPLYEDMKAKYDKYWKNIPLPLALASCMDPRHKLTTLDLCLDLHFPSPPPPPPPPPHLPQPPYVPTEKEIKMTYYEAKLAELYEEYSQKMNNNGANVSDTPTDLDVGNDDEDTNLVNLMLRQRRQASTQTCKSDLQHYLGQPAIPDTDRNFDVLKWWKKHAGMYPVLSAMARDLLTIPVSTVPSESTFSGSERVVSKNRSCLAPETVEALICLRDWYMAESDTQDDDVEDIDQLMAGELW